jgi:hypothetical protein
VALPLSPFATVDKQSVIGILEATGSHDPDVLERERAHLLAAARAGWIAGTVLVSIGITVCFTGAGILAGVPVLVVAAWLIYRGNRNVDAIKSGVAEFVKPPGP